jgi:hypothetical protein
MALGTAALVALAAASGNFQMPVVAGDARAGLSADGRTAVLAEPPSNGRTRFAVLDRQTRRLVRVISLRGDYGFDATSPDGNKLYVIQYRSADHRKYAIQSLRTAEETPSVRTVVEKGEPGERMSGLPISRVSSRDGGWVYTLYDGSAGHEPFIHALQAKDGFTVCIDLDALEDRPDLAALTLSIDRGGRAVTVAGKQPILKVDTESFGVNQIAADAKPAAAAVESKRKPTQDQGSSIPALAFAALGLTVTTLALFLRARRRRRLSSVLRVNV